MDALLKLSRLIDALNERIGLVANCLVLIACAISAGNALMRYGFSLSSNAWLEIQWYLFAGIVMLGAAHTLNRNEHVRVDVFYSRYGERARLWLDLLGGILFLLPMAVIIGWLSWPLFWNSYEVGEVSANAGGLLRWPVKLLIPLGFLLLALQGLSEIIKRAAALSGRLRLESRYERPRK
jgi:TRAP-type mannitol/chloroaromatic compound transport system permease small subunit